MTGPKTYLPETYFNDKNYYAAEIGADGLIVISECCADTMSEATARVVHEALGRWLADRDEARRMAA